MLVMDVTHKFLNRDVEHEQLKSSVKEAEVEDHEAKLNLCQKEHQQSCNKLQQSRTLQAFHNMYVSRVAQRCWTGG
eukprot:symbB.v1.2.001995.t1/scaffold53.1/size378684/16